MAERRLNFGGRVYEIKATEIFDGSQTVVGANGGRSLFGISATEEDYRRDEWLKESFCEGMDGNVCLLLGISCQGFKRINMMKQKSMGNVTGQIKLPLEEADKRAKCLIQSA